MFARLAYAVFGSSNDRALKGLYKEVERINALEPEFEPLTDEQLRAKTDEFRSRLEKGETLDDIKYEAFATVREAAKRTLGQRHFDVQLIGGLTLNQGKIAEMRTGEGKTLVGTLPIYLNAIEGKGVHVVTVNDYLASRDAAWMGQIYEFLGLSVGCVIADMEEEDRRDAYQADITYGTNNEFGFDYLRDNMKFRIENLVQRPFNFAIVDEVDSILIDEARTPLIISGPAEASSDDYGKADAVVKMLEPSHYEKEEKLKSVTLTEDGVERVEEISKEMGILTEGSLFDAQNISFMHNINQALRAHTLFARDVDYVVNDGRIVIIDEFTGRMQEGRRYSEGLHQALEAREGVEIQNENQTLASVTYQNYFRLYPKLAGMTGTAMTEAAEFMDIYELAVVDIPTNLDVKRVDQNDKIYKTAKEKYDAIGALTAHCYKKKQPVLVGTTSIEKSEYLSALLKKLKIPHQVLNARYHAQESQIIAQAGRPGAVTIATNMAGRGTDIQLGGNLEMRITEEIDASLPDDKKKALEEKIHAEIEEARQHVRDVGGLYIIGTERHEARRIDNQLRGRSGRQGDLGESAFFLSLEDDLMRIFGSDKMQMFLANKHIGLKDGEALTHPWISKALEKAQLKVEEQNFEIRKNLLKFDNVMNDQRMVIYEQRRDIMSEDDVKEMVMEMRHDIIDEIVATCIPAHAYAEQWDIKSLKHECQRVLNLELPIDEWAQEEGIADTEIADRIQEASDKKMDGKMGQVTPKVFHQLEKAILLQKLDQHWKDHLLNLDHLRQGINLRAIGQRDPLNEYKAEAFSLFEAMLEALREDVTTTLSMVEFNVEEPLPDLMPTLSSLPMQETHGEEPAANPMQQQRPFDKNDPTTWGKVARNAPCPCGSGKKYKHCHGAM